MSIRERLKGSPRLRRAGIGLVALACVATWWVGRPEGDSRTDAIARAAVAQLGYQARRTTAEGYASELLAAAGNDASVLAVYRAQNLGGQKPTDDLARLSFRVHVVSDEEQRVRAHAQGGFNFFDSPALDACYEVVLTRHGIRKNSGPKRVDCPAVVVPLDFPVIERVPTAGENGVFSGGPPDI